MQTGTIGTVCSRAFSKIIENRSIYRRKLIKIPRPEFIVLYNGDAEYPDMGRLRLSDAFVEADVPGMLELTVRSCKAITCEIQRRIFFVGQGGRFH
jgi:hypothetical protein